MNGWKVAAIIFIILFILENIGLAYVTYVAIDSNKKENECSFNICRDYSSYAYDYQSNACYCYDGDEIKYSRYMG